MSYIANQLIKMYIQLCCCKVANLTVNVNVSIAIRSALKLHIEKEKLFLKILTPKNDEEKETLSN
jgi:hypothetical protein